MKTGLILAMAAALLVSGCGNLNCNGATANGGAAGDCGIHATFLTARTGNQPTAAFRKS